MTRWSPPRGGVANLLGPGLAGVAMPAADLTTT
jgi:hypothetical protein